MFERFTARARRVLVLAQEESVAHGHSFLGTEHILLGLLLEGEGVAAKALLAQGVDLDECREQVLAVLAAASPGATDGAGRKGPPFTPKAKRVLEMSLREALALGHNYIGTEHLLLGLVREGEGVAAQVLTAMGIDLTGLRDEVVRQLGALTGGRPYGTDRGTPGALAALGGARARAGSGPMGTHHLLLALLDNGDSLAHRVLTSFGLTVEAAQARIEEMGTKGTTDEFRRVGRKRSVDIVPGIRLEVDDEALAEATGTPLAADLSRDDLLRVIEILRQSIEDGPPDDPGDGGQGGGERPPDN